jgi:hypothetical protein
MVLLMLTKIPYGLKPVAKVIAYGFHVVDG